MKKKILGVLLSLAMVGTLMAGCGQQQGVEDQNASKTDSAQTEESADAGEDKEDGKKQLCTGSKGRFKSRRYSHWRSCRRLRIQLRS